MPFDSKAQSAACFASKGFDGKVDCKEWASKTNYSKLPKKKKKKSILTLPILKADGGGMGGMSTTSGGAGLVTVGMGSYPKTRKRKKMKKSVRVDEITTDTEILRAGISVEYDAINLYEKMANKTSNEDIKKILLDVSDEEKVHIGEFEKLLDNIDSSHQEKVLEGKDEAEQKLEEKSIFRLPVEKSNG